jgi:PAS domain S-box-containing protein
MSAQDTAADVTDSLMDVRRISADPTHLETIQRILNNNPAVVFLWRNQDGWPVEHVTENVEHLTGYTAREWLEGAVSYSDIIDSQDLERVGREVRDFSADLSLKEFTHAPYRIHSRTGAVKWVEDRTQIRRDRTGAVIHYEGLVYDITQLQETRLALVNRTRDLERQKILQERILDAVGEGVVYIAGDYRVLQGNRQWMDMCGLSPTAWNGRKCREALPNDLCGTKDCPMEQFLAGAEEVTGETRITGRDGSKIDTLITARAVRDQDGRLLGIVESLRDLTTVRRAEEGRRWAYEAQAAATARAEMAAQVLHHIGNAITPIGIYVEAMKEKTARGLIEYLEKSYQGLRGHMDDLQSYLSEDGRGRQVFEYMNALIQSLKEQQEQRQETIRKIDHGLSDVLDILARQQRDEEERKMGDGC